jgi:hypothetical protein
MIVVSAAMAVLSFFYEGVVKPTLQDAIRYRLFAKRDELRRLAIEGNCNCESLTYHHLQKMINAMANATSWYSVSVWLESMQWKSDNPEAQAEVKRQMELFEREATFEMKQIERKSLDLILRAMLVNSPGWTAMCCVVLIARSFNRRLSGWNRALWYRVGSGYRPVHA